jgi:hypothetical protein
MMTRHNLSKIPLRYLGAVFTLAALGFFGITGTAPAPPAPVMRPIRVSADGHSFTAQNGNPFFWMGDTSWELMYKFSRTDAERYLEDRRLKGFTVVQAFARLWGQQDPPNLDGQTAWLNNNPATPNDAFFQNVDYIVDLANQKGIVVALFSNSSGAVVSSHLINSSNAYTWGRWIGSRYRNSPNIVWVLGGDGAPSGYEAVFRAEAAGIQAGDGGSHLITYHPGDSANNRIPNRWPYSSSDFLQHESWLGFNMIQSGGVISGLYTKVRSDHDMIPIRPTGIGEGAYEGGRYNNEIISPLMIRQQAYWSYLAGGYHTYGHTAIDSLKDGLNWVSALDAPGAQQLAILRNLFASRKWWKLVPDQSVLVFGASSGLTQQAAARSTGGDSLIIYLGNPTTISVAMGKITTSSSVQATWFNPQTGSQTIIGTFPNTGSRTFRTPQTMTDAVLLLDAARTVSSRYPQPEQSGSMSSMHRLVVVCALSILVTMVIFFRLRRCWWLRS